MVGMTITPTKNGRQAERLDERVDGAHQLLRQDREQRRRPPQHAERDRGPSTAARRGPSGSCAAQHLRRGAGSDRTRLSDVQRQQHDRDDDALLDPVPRSVDAASVENGEHGGTNSPMTASTSSVASRPAIVAVEPLGAVAQAAEEQAGAEHQQQVADDRARDATP